MSHSAKILFFLCLNDRGGAEISMVRLAEALLEAGHRVSLAVYGEAPELATTLGFTGEIFILENTRTLGALVPLVRLLRLERFSTLISALTHTNIVALVAAKLARTGAHVIVSEHGIDGVSACETSWFFRLLTRNVYSSAAAVVAVSYGLARKWQEILKPKALVQTIYNPIVSTHSFASSVQLPPILRQTDTPVLIGVGRLKEEKNFSLLIKAFARLASRRPAYLIIIGEGPERKNLEDLIDKLGIADQVLLPGFMEAPQAWIEKAALLVCPSKREGFGNVIVEALACGIPVVSTDCPYGPAEILQNGVYGSLVAVDDLDGMVRAIADTLESLPDRNKLRERAQDFTVARSIALYEALIAR